MKKNSIWVIILICQSLAGFGQMTPLRVGDQVPDFTLGKIRHYQTELPVSSDDLKGKHVILDFWTTGCLSCVESMPKIDKLRKHFKDQIQFILIGKDRLGKQPTELAEKVFEKYRQRFGFDLPSSFNAALFEQFSVSMVPFVVWINDQGVVKAITPSGELTERNLEKFLSDPGFQLSETGGELVKAEPEIHPASKPVKAVDTKGVISKWNRNTKMVKPLFISSSEKHWHGIEPNKVHVEGVPLAELYRLAYGDSVPVRPGFYYYRDSLLAKAFRRSVYGDYWRLPVWETADSALFVSDIRSGKNLFSYNLVVPMASASTQYLKECMQKDLQVTFGYQVIVQKRQMPCWRLVVSDSAKAANLKNNGAACRLEHSPVGFNLSNIPVYQLIRQIWEYNDGQIPIIDDTGITHHIDIQLEGVMTDINEVIASLRKSGLDLQRSEKEMKVIVIRGKPGSEKERVDQRLSE